MIYVCGYVICDDGVLKNNSRWGCLWNYFFLGKLLFNIVVIVGWNNDIFYLRVFFMKGKKDFLWYENLNVLEIVFGDLL